MGRVSGHRLVGACILILLNVAVASGQGVKVRVREGSARGFLVLRSETGAILTRGILMSPREPDQGPNRLPLQRRLVTKRRPSYSQNSTFRLVAAIRLVQRG